MVDISFGCILSLSYLCHGNRRGSSAVSPWVVQCAKMKKQCKNRRLKLDERLLIWTKANWMMLRLRRARIEVGDTAFLILIKENNHQLHFPRIRLLGATGFRVSHGSPSSERRSHAGLTCTRILLSYRTLDFPCNRRLFSMPRLEILTIRLTRTDRRSIDRMIIVLLDNARQTRLDSGFLGLRLNGPGIGFDVRGAQAEIMLRRDVVSHFRRQRVDGKEPYVSPENRRLEVRYVTQDDARIERD